MADKGGSDYERSLDQTPTWAVAGVCAVIILVSLGLEKLLHKIGAWLTKKHKKALHEALDIIKSELMILGFISLLLVFFQYYIVEICIPNSVADTMLPCKKSDTPAKARNLQEKEEKKSPYRKCDKGKVSLISVYGLHEIHILIFFMALFHMFYSGITMALGRLKMRGWKKWEDETSSHDYEFSNDPTRFRLAHETSFVRAHNSSWARNPFFFYIGCFFRQFFRSVSKSDYLTLRNGFIAVHLAPGNKFNFQKYIKRSLEDDYKTVVGVSPLLWASFVVFLLLNVSRWNTMFWASLIPVILILLIGTQLQAILTRMALEITDRHAVVQGIPIVQASDKLFWFNRPRLLLHLIHFSLFQNAFQVTYYVWAWYDRYGIKKCFRKNVGLVVGKVCVGLAVLFVCSYITLPLYALITQMGSHMKKTIFDEQTTTALKKWHGAAKKKHESGHRHGEERVRTFGDGAASPTSSMGSPFHPTGATLQRFKTTGHSAQSHGYDDHYASDLEDPATPPAPTATLIVRSDPSEHDRELGNIGEETRNGDDFSFAKDAPNRQ